jgi:hypothetical protein
MGVASQKQVDNLIIGGRKLRASEYIYNAEKTADINISNLLDRISIDLVDALEKNAPVGSGKLAKSIQVLSIKKQSGSWRLEIGFGDAYYHDFIDKGVKGIKNKRKVFKRDNGTYYQFKTYGMPPEALKQLEGWAKRNNIQLNKKVAKGKSPASSLAYFIKKYGIEGRNYKETSAKEVLPKYQAKLIEVGFDSIILKITK